MDARTARYVQIGLGLLLVAVIAWAFTLSGDEGGSDLPEPVEAVSPTDGSQTPRQAPVVVDMAVGYDVTLFIQDRGTGEWVAVPTGQTSFEPATGVLTWSPPEDAAPAGQFRLRLEYVRVNGLPESGAYEWSVRTY